MEKEFKDTIERCQKMKKDKNQTILQEKESNEEDDAIGPGKGPFTDEEIAKHFAEKEFKSLSDKITFSRERFKDRKVVYTEDIKEFIERLKVKIVGLRRFQTKYLVITKALEELNELAGPKLTK